MSRMLMRPPQSLPMSLWIYRALLILYPAEYRREWRKAGRALVLIGPAFLFFEFFIISHASDPCGFGFADFRTEHLGSPLCQAWGGGPEIHTRYQLLHHALVPTVFLVGCYLWALGRWQAAERFAWRGNRRGSATIG